MEYIVYGMLIVFLIVSTGIILYKVNDDNKNIICPHNSHKAYVQENENGSVYLCWKPDDKSEKCVLVYEEKR